MEQMRLARTKT